MKNSFLTHKTLVWVTAFSFSAGLRAETMDLSSVTELQAGHPGGGAPSAPHAAPSAPSRSAPSAPSHSAPSAPNRSTPNRSIPTGPSRPTPTGPTHSIPTGPLRPAPTGPTHSIPTGPSRSFPTNPSRTPTGPSRSIPTGPSHSAPTGPSHSIPTGPTRSMPTGPSRSIPTGPSHSSPTGPSRATPTGPTRPITPTVPTTPSRSRAGGTTSPRAGGATNGRVTNNNRTAQTTHVNNARTRSTTIQNNARYSSTVNNYRTTYNNSYAGRDRSRSQSYASSFGRSGNWGRYHSWYGDYRHYGFYGGYNWGYSPWSDVGAYFAYPLVDWFYQDSVDSALCQGWYGNDCTAYPFSNFAYRRVYDPTTEFRDLLVGVSDYPAEAQANFRADFVTLSEKLAQQMSDDIGSEVTLAENDVVINHYDTLGENAVVVEGAVTHEDQTFAFKALLDLQDTDNTIVFVPASTDGQPTQEEVQTLDQMNARIKDLGGTVEYGLDPNGID